MELKLVADVGIIGVPNAGKSTLLSVLTRAKPKIANYQFTTLVPNLGVCELDYRSTVFADIPGKQLALLTYCFCKLMEHTQWLESCKCGAMQCKQVA